MFWVVALTDVLDRSIIRAALARCKRENMSGQIQIIDKGMIYSLSIIITWQFIRLFLIINKLSIFQIIGKSLCLPLIPIPINHICLVALLTQAVSVSFCQAVDVSLLEEVTLTWSMALHMCVHEVITGLIDVLGAVATNGKSAFTSLQMYVVVSRFCLSYDVCFCRMLETVILG